MFLWLPLVAVAAHLVEEFLWPGGFAAWYRTYRPEYASSITRPYLVAVNALLVVLALIPPFLGSTPRAYAVWAVVAAIGAANAVFHLWATAKTRAYSPGVVTGALVYLPLAIVGIPQLLTNGRVSLGTALQAVIVGVAYHLWSAWRHRQRAARRV